MLYLISSNKKNDTNTIKKTVRRHVFRETKDIKHQVLRSTGQFGALNKDLWDALLSGLHLYIILENSACSSMLNRNKLTNTSEKVVQQKGIKSTGKLFDYLVCDIAEEVNVLTTSSNMEKRRLLWSMYNSINTWFKLLKKELIAMGFARAATAEDGDKDEGGELIFFPGQLDRTLNIDESEVLTDGTS